MKILIIGEQGSGKTTLRKLMEDQDFMDGFSTSDFLISLMSNINNISEEVIRANKEQYRSQLVDMGNQLCDIYPGIIVAACLLASFDDNVIIDGVRRKNEFESVAHMFDKIFYVYRPGSEAASTDNFELHEYRNDPRVEVLVNDGYPADLYNAAIGKLKSA